MKSPSPLSDKVFYGPPPPPVPTIDAANPLNPGDEEHGRRITPPQSKNIAAAWKDFSRTPISHKQTGHYAYGTPPPDSSRRARRLRELAQETQGKYVGPMEPAAFLDRYLPESPAVGAQRGPNFLAIKLSKVSEDAKVEKDMYKPFIDIMERHTPKLRFVKTSESGDKERDFLSADVSTYEKIPSTNIKQTDFSLMEVPIEFKLHSSRDPFIDPDDLEDPPDATDDNPFPFERNSDDAILDRGQVASYATAVMGSQFRLHVFLVVIFGQYARLMRWDRNGVIVTRKFIYSKERHLVNFFTRYSDADRCARGHDPTVTASNEDDLKPTENKLPALGRLQDANRFHREFRTILVPDREDASKEFRFLISYPPRFTARSPFGRATKPMLAFDLEKDKAVFVKDYWRPVADTLEKEGDIYLVLKEKNVPYIAPFGRGNDVRNHVTQTDTDRAQLANVFPTKAMSPLHQYRMSLDKIGRRLVEFKSSRECVRALADGMEAHECAFHDAQILHRDISAGNIIITDEGEGLLIDWDLCLNMAKQPAEARRSERTGTWQFMSYALLANSRKLQDITDDQESVLYVLTWTALRYTKHSHLRNLFNELKLYDEADVGPDQVTGGKRKRTFLTEGTDVRFTDRPSLDALIDELRCHFSDVYSLETPTEIQRKRYEKTIATDPEAAEEHVAHKYYCLQKRLENRKWLVETFRKHLATESWPTDDVSCANKIISIGLTEQKRSSHQADLEERVGSTKSQKLSSGANSRAASSPLSSDAYVFRSGLASGGASSGAGSSHSLAAGFYAGGEKEGSEKGSDSDHSNSNS